MRNRAAGIVIHSEQILLIRRRKSGKEYFVIPGGGVEEQETPEQAVIRELLEETCVSTKMESLLYKISWDNSDIHFFYKLQYQSGTPQLAPDSPERIEMKQGLDFYNPEWLPLAALSDTTLYPLEVRDLILDDLSSGFSARRDAPLLLSLKVAERRE